MIDLLLEPFSYIYMQKAMAICALVGGVCAFLSAYLMLKGWSLMGDALSHSVVPGVAIAHLLHWPYAIGAFLAGIIAVCSMFLVKQKTKLKEDATIGLVFTGFFGLGLLLISLNPVAINLQTIVLGNILAISDFDLWQVVLISAGCLVVLTLKWKDLMLVFFDESYIRIIGISPVALKILFFALLSLATVAALQVVGAFLVIAMVITPGTTAYLLTDRFGRLIIISVGLGVGVSFLGVYISYFLDTHPGGMVVSLQTLIFLVVFLLAPKYGFLPTKWARLKSRLSSAQYFFSKS